MHRWDENLWVIKPSEFEQLPDGCVLKCINGKFYTKGKDVIDQDTRFGHIAFGVEDPINHPQAEYFTKFRLS